MAEKLTSNNESEQQDKSPYEGMSRDALDALIAARESVDSESDTPNGDLRTAVREALEASGDEQAFRRVYDMNNLELQSFVEGASVEAKHRHVEELRAIISAYDDHESFGDRRAALRETLEAAGDTSAFRAVYDMNNLELTAFVDDARRQLQDETAPSEEDALDQAYAEYEEREGSPYGEEAPDNDKKDHVESKDEDKDTEAAHLLAEVEKLAKLIESDVEAARKTDVREKLRELLAEIDRHDTSSNDTPEREEDTDDSESHEQEQAEPSEAEVQTPEVVEPDGDDDDGEVPDPKRVEFDTEEKPARKRFGFVGRAWDRLRMFYAEGGGTPVGMAVKGMERFRSSRRAKVAAAAGALAILGVAIAGRHYGWFDGGGHQHGQGVDSGDGGVSANGGGNGGEVDNGFFPSTSENPMIAPEGVDLNSAYPWDWMKAAMEHDLVKPPQGMGPEQALHYYGQKAAEAGHRVEWYNLPNGREAIRVDGSDRTKSVVEVLSQFAK